MPEPACDTGMIGIFNRFSFLTVAGAGLIDGINPCAFGVLIFFFSYLTLKGRSRRDIFLTGLLFTLGVFVAYFLIGLGLMQAFFKLAVVPLLSKLLYPALALFTLGMAIYTWFDYRIAIRPEGRDQAETSFVSVQVN